MSLFYYLETFLAKLVLRLVTRWEVRGKENVSTDGPLVVASNHLSVADPPVLAASIQRRVVFMAKVESFRHPIQGPLVRGFGAFPVRRGQVDREALRWAQETLKSGLALGMFPEGTRSVAAKLQEGRPGTALVALRGGAPILPVAVTGTERVRGIGFIFARVPITVNIGQPFVLPPVDGKLTRDQLAKATKVIMERIAELLPAGYRDEHGDQEGR